MIECLKYHEDCKTADDLSLVSVLKQLLSEKFANIENHQALNLEQEYLLFQTLFLYKTEQQISFSEDSGSIIIQLLQDLLNIKDSKLIPKLYAVFSTSPNIVTQANYYILRANQNLDIVIRALYFFHAGTWHWPAYGFPRSMLTQDIFDDITGHYCHSDLQSFARALKELCKADILNQENRGVIKTVQDPYILALALVQLHKVGILNQENSNAIAIHLNLEVLNSVIEVLLEGNILTQQNFDVIKTHQNLATLAKALSILHSAAILKQQNFDAIKDHLYIRIFAVILDTLHKADILNQQIFDAIKAHQSPMPFASTLLKLHKAGLLNQETFAAVRGYPTPYLLDSVLVTLNKAGILNKLTQQDFDDITSYSNLRKFTNALNALNTANILTQKNFEVVKTHCELAVIVLMLHRNDILTQKIFQVILAHKTPATLAMAFSLIDKVYIEQYLEVVKDHPKLGNLVSVLKILDRANILNHANFGRILANPIITDKRACIALGMLPLHLLDMATFEELIKEDDIERLLSNIDKKSSDFYNTRPDLQDRQSTHNTTVHQSAAHSAKNLLIRYHDELKRNGLTVLTEIGEWANKLPVEDEKVPDLHDKNLVVKRAVNLLLKHKAYYAWLEPGTNIRLCQLFLVVWIGLHDAKLREGSLEDGINMLKEGLYEILRDGNLDEQNRDNGGPDRPACPPGVFNKLIEKLQGIHPDIVMRYITKCGASVKLPIVVKETTRDWLDRFPLETTEQTEQFKILMAQIKDRYSGVPELIWQNIKPIISETMFEEFADAYNNDIRDPDFIGLIEAGEYTDLSQLFQNKLSASEGSHGSIQLGSMCLFSQQNDRSETNHDSSSSSQGRMSPM